MAVGRGGGSGIDNIEFQLARDLDWVLKGPFSMVLCESNLKWTFSGSHFLPRQNFPASISLPRSQCVSSLDIFIYAFYIFFMAKLSEHDDPN